MVLPKVEEKISLPVGYTYLLICRGHLQTKLLNQFQFPAPLPKRPFPGPPVIDLSLLGLVLKGERRVTSEDAVASEECRVTARGRTNCLALVSSSGCRCICYLVALLFQPTVVGEAHST